ncbi:signal peptidase I [Ruania albidiflava]|uniref:signal peptidase I n=1 Tax=Ruania albidiflava TaxID=366586 RepID=UPI0023F55CA6|nr:signal peptidase I [Ruania albidiflava]
MAAGDEHEDSQSASARADDVSEQMGRARSEDAAAPGSSTPEAGEATSASASAKNRRRRHPIRAFLRESVIVVVCALVLSLVIKTFLAQAFYIPSVSMEPTLMVGDRLVVNKLVPQVMDIDRGDVVVFLDPGGWLDTPPHELNAAEQVLTWIGLLPEHADEHVIKRVIGTGGDHVVCCTAEGLITVNGEPIEEPYLVPGAVPSERPFDVTVPESHLFVLGDNRPRSADSRAHAGAVGGGFVPVRNVVGRAFVITWPLDRITWLSNPTETFADVPDP